MGDNSCCLKEYAVTAVTVKGRRRTAQQMRNGVTWRRGH
jgi:hypothetical protein